MTTQRLIRKDYRPGDFLGILLNNLFRPHGKFSLNIPLLADPDRVGFKSYIQEKPSRASILPNGLSPRMIEEIAESRQLTGMGGGGFALHKKLKAWRESPSEPKEILINGVECDPGLFHDKWLIRHKLPEILTMAETLAKCYGAQATVLAHRLENIPLSRAWPIRFARQEDFYPVGEEKTLIKGVFHGKPQDYRYPTDIGILVINIQTLYLLYLALFQEEQVNRRYLTLLDLEEGLATVLECSRGMKISDIGPFASGNTSLFIGGGAMHGRPAQSHEVITGEINLIAFGSLEEHQEERCRNCGQCNRYCPAKLNVKEIHQGKMEQERIQGQLKDCINCGSCSYLCPSKIPLTNYIQDCIRRNP